MFIINTKLRNAELFIKIKELFNMEDKKVLTPEQEAELAALTPEEREQLKALVGPDGKVKEEELALVSGGARPRVTKILGWGTAALFAATTAAEVVPKLTKDKWGHEYLKKNHNATGTSSC